MPKYIKNNDTISHTWCGQLIAAENYYEIQPLETVTWANNSQLLTDIANQLAIVAKSDDGNNDIVDINTAVNYLKDDLPREVTDVMLAVNEKFFSAVVAAGGEESEQAWTITPDNGEVMTIKEMRVEAPLDRNAYVAFIWDYDTENEEELYFSKGSAQSYRPLDMTLTGDGTKKLAIVLVNTADVGDVKLGGLLKYNLE